jgi:hypothetical protein
VDGGNICVACITSDYITLQRCFWEEKKNGEVIEHYSVTLSVGPYLLAPYRFWKHTNNTTGKKSIFLNTANNNFLEGINYNYSCAPVTSPGKCKTNEVTPITNYCSVIKSIKNMETQSIGIKSL